MKFKDEKGRTRERRIQHYFGDYLSLTREKPITITQIRKIWAEQTKKEKESINAIKNAEKEAQKIMRQHKKTPSRSYVGKHDKHVRELEL